MSIMFEELAHCHTRIGELILRRRRLRREGEDIWEIMLDGGYLMSSQFVAGEIALAKRALAALDGDGLKIAVAGLGLGYTAKAVLEDARAAALTVIELVPEVIAWHREGLLPLGPALTLDPRCRFVEGDFFAIAASPPGSNDAMPGIWDAILVDIDHSTHHLIEESSAGFYDRSALELLSAHLRPGGIFALWSSGAEDPAFVTAMREVFHEVRAERLEFLNPYRDEPAFNIVYLGRRR